MKTCDITAHLEAVVLTAADDGDPGLVEHLLTQWCAPRVLDLGELSRHTHVAGCAAVVWVELSSHLTDGLGQHLVPACGRGRWWCWLCEKISLTAHSGIDETTSM